VNVCMSLVDFNDAARDLQNQPRVDQCQFCK
jgi:hypothetical protein